MAPIEKLAAPLPDAVLDEITACVSDWRAIHDIMARLCDDVGATGWYHDYCRAGVGSQETLTKDIQGIILDYLFENDTDATIIERLSTDPTIPWREVWLCPESIMLAVA